MSAWIQEVKSVQAELGCTYKEAMTEASRRRKEGVTGKGLNHEESDYYFEDEVSGYDGYEVTPFGGSEGFEGYDDDPEGSGIISEIGRHWRGILMALKGNRTNFRPDVRRWLADNGDYPILSMAIVRRPIKHAYQEIVAGVSRRHPDQLFHLMIICLFSNGQWARIEKNEDINIDYYKREIVDETQKLQMPVGGLTVGMMMANAVQKISPSRMFVYDAFTWNCQRFVLDVLDANNIPVSGEVQKWVLQDVTNLVPRWAEVLARFVTGLANRGKTLIEGEGIPSGDEWTDEHYEDYEDE